MTERPILFSGAMVRALLSGQKTQTRRVLRDQPNAGPNGQMVDLGGAWGLSDGCLSGEWRCPYGVPGDRLWVRETWQTTTTPQDRDGELFYAADHDGGRPRSIEDDWCWRPSIHMPRWASRLTLEVTEVRVQRLQDISEEDAWAEGMGDVIAGIAAATPDPRLIFADLWDSLNAKRAPWDSNPWIWAVSFRRVQPLEPNGDAQ